MAYGKSRRRRPTVGDEEMERELSKSIEELGIKLGEEREEQEQPARYRREALRSLLE